MKGLILFDIHYPVNIDLEKALKNAPRDNDIVIIGGDVLDMKYLFGLHSKSPSTFDPDEYEEDVGWLENFLKEIRKEFLKKDGKLIFLEGNHEVRMTDWIKKYPTFKRYALKGYIGKLVDKYIPYRTEKSYIKIGDTIVIHGDYWGEYHGKKHLHAWGRKVLYGHTHDAQRYDDRTHNMNKYSKFAQSFGCLCSKAPDWKHTPNRWVNGYTTFIVNKGVLIPTFHQLEKGINY